MTRAARPSIGLPRVMRLEMGAIGLVVIGIGVAVILQLAGLDVGGDWTDGGSWWALPPALVLIAVGMWMLLFVRLQLDITDDELIIQNKLRRVTIRRDDIVRIYASDAGVYVDYLDGTRVRTVESDAAQGYLQMSLFNRKGRPQRVADNLNEWLLSGDASPYR